MAEDTPYVADDAPIDSTSYEIYEVEDLSEDEEEDDFTTAGVPNPDEVKDVNVCDRMRFFRRDKECFCKTPSGQVIKVDSPKKNSDGTHVVDVIDKGEPIPGSPYIIRFNNNVNKTKVRAYGRGLQSGLRSDFVPMFRVNTSGGGEGMLKVSVTGPKGFKVDITRDAKNHRIADIDYRLATDRYARPVAGIYTIGIRWLDEHIKDSPFELLIAKDEKELQKWNLDPDEIRSGKKN